MFFLNIFSLVAGWLLAWLYTLIIPGTRLWPNLQYLQYTQYYYRKQRAPEAGRGELVCDPGVDILVVVGAVAAGEGGEAVQRHVALAQHGRQPLVVQNVL